MHIILYQYIYLWYTKSVLIGTPIFWIIGVRYIDIYRYATY